MSDAIELYLPTAINNSMQRDPLFVTMFLLIAIAAVTGVALLIYDITQKTAKVGEERTQGLVEKSANLFEIVAL